MNILRFFLVALVWGLLCHGNARADVILRGFDPVVPNTGQIPSLVLDIIRGGGITTCEGARADVPASVSVQGNLIIVKLFMSRIFIGVPACQAEPSVIGLRWPLASVLPPGTFTVRVFGCAQCFGTSTSPEFLIGELPITILAADMPVPMLGLPQLILFSFTLLLVGVWRLRNATSHLAIHATWACSNGACVT